MTPLAMAKAECANMRPDGGCLGITVNSLVSEKNGLKVNPVAAPLDCCKLAKAGKRCEYFEKTVVPLANHYPDKYAKAVELYSAGRANNALSIKGARECECGAPLPKRKRFCAICAKRNRRQTARDGMDRIRSSVVSS